MEFNFCQHQKLIVILIWLSGVKTIRWNSQKKRKEKRINTLITYHLNHTKFVTKNMKHYYKPMNHRIPIKKKKKSSEGGGGQRVGMTGFCFLLFHQQLFTEWAWWGKTHKRKKARKKKKRHCTQVVGGGDREVRDRDEKAFALLFFSFWKSRVKKQPN